jgi:hypothetical protein
VKAKGLSLGPVTVTTPASTTTTTELSAQTVQTMPDGCHLTVEVVNSRVKLTKRLSLLNNSKVHSLVTDLITATEVIPHEV